MFPLLVALLRAHYLEHTHLEGDALHIEASEHDAFRMYEFADFNLTRPTRARPDAGHSEVQATGRGWTLACQGQHLLEIRDLFLKDEWASFEILDPSVKYGLGERFQLRMRVEDGFYTIHNRDRLGTIDLHK
jgi:hypothetical protein